MSAREATNADQFLHDPFFAFLPLVGPLAVLRALRVLRVMRLISVVPSLRNVARTAPYMHDGRFGTLAQVLAHYDHGVQPSSTLDPLLRQPGGQLGIPLTPPERACLLAFLHTLTDSGFIADRRLLPPAQ